MISVGNKEVTAIRVGERVVATVYICLLYTSDAAAE